MTGAAWFMWFLVFIATDRKTLGAIVPEKDMAEFSEGISSIPGQRVMGGGMSGPARRYSDCGSRQRQPTGDCSLICPGENETHSHSDCLVDHSSVAVPPSEEGMPLLQSMSRTGESTQVEAHTGPTPSVHSHRRVEEPLLAEDIARCAYYGLIACGHCLRCLFCCLIRPWSCCFWCRDFLRQFSIRRDHY